MSDQDKPLVGARCFVDTKIGIGWVGICDDKMDELLDDTREEAAMNVIGFGVDAITAELQSRFPDSDDGTVSVMYVDRTGDGYGRAKHYWIKTDLPMLPVVTAETLTDHLPRLKKLVTIAPQHGGTGGGSGDFYRYRHQDLGHNVYIRIYSYEPNARIKDRHKQALRNYRETQTTEFEASHLRDLLSALGPDNWPNSHLYDTIRSIEIREAGGWGRSATHVTLAHIRKTLALMKRLRIKVKDMGGRDAYDLINALRAIEPYFCSVEETALERQSESDIDTLKQIRSLYRQLKLPQPRLAKPPKEPEELIRAREKKNRGRGQAITVRRRGPGVRPAVSREAA